MSTMSIEKFLACAWTPFTKPRSYGVTFSPHQVNSLTRINPSKNRWTPLLKAARRKDILSTTIRWRKVRPTLLRRSPMVCQRGVTAIYMVQACTTFSLWEWSRCLITCCRDCQGLDLGQRFQRLGIAWDIWPTHADGSSRPEDAAMRGIKSWRTFEKKKLVPELGSTQWQEVKMIWHNSNY